MHGSRTGSLSVATPHLCGANIEEVTERVGIGGQVGSVGDDKVDARLMQDAGVVACSGLNARAVGRKAGLAHPAAVVAVVTFAAVDEGRRMVVAFAPQWHGMSCGIARTHIGDVALLHDDALNREELRARRGVLCHVLICLRRLHIFHGHVGKGCGPLGRDGCLHHGGVLEKAAEALRHGLGPVHQARQRQAATVWSQTQRTRRWR